MELIVLETGYELCGGPEGHEAVSEVFLDAAADDIASIERFYESKDTENYVIQVHGLKNASRVIGGTVLGDMAYELELAGKAGNWALIEEKNAALLDTYRDTIAELKRKLGK